MPKGTGYGVVEETKRRKESLEEWCSECAARDGSDPVNMRVW